MAETTIGALSVRISADTRGLKRGMKETDSLLQKGRKGLNENAGAWGKWGVAIVAANVVAAAAIFKSTSASIKELQNLSFAANTVTEEFQRGAFGAAKFGIETEKYGDILKDVNDKIGDFITTGGGPMVDFFEQVAPLVDVTAESFRGLSGQQALGLYVKSLEDANLTQQEMTFHMEAIASDSTLLIPLFKDNAKALKEFSAEAEALGIGLNAIDIAKVQQANKELAAIGALIEGTLQQATVELAPLVTALATAFTGVAKEAGGASNAIRNSIDGIIDSVGFVLDAIDGIDRSFELVGKGIALVALSIKGIFLKMADFMVNIPVEAANELISALNSVFDTGLNEISLTGFGQSIKDEFDLTFNAIDAGMNDISDVLMRPIASEALKTAVSEARAASEELAKIAERDKAASEAVDFITSGDGGSVKQLEEETRLRLEALTARQTAEQELRAEGFAFDAEAFATSLLTKQELEDFNNEVNEQKQQEHKDRIAEIDRAAAAVQMQQAATALSAMATLASVGGKKSEKAVRAISIAIAIIKGHSSAISAYEAGMATGGPAAPATAALYAAASIAQTGMMIARLKGGSKSSSKPSGSIPVGSSRGTDNGRGGIDGGQQRRFNITLVGSTFNADQVRELMSAIGEQVGDGVEFNLGV